MDDTAEYEQHQEYLKTLRKKKEQIEDILDSPEPDTGYGALTDTFTKIEQYTQDKRTQQTSTEVQQFPLFHEGLKNILFDTYTKHQQEGKPITIGGLFSETSLELQGLVDELQKNELKTIPLAMYVPQIAQIGTAITETQIVDMQTYIPGITPQNT